MDDNYPIYLNRITRMTHPDSYLSGLQHIQTSPKFQLDPNGVRKAVPFPGCSVITPPGAEDPKNQGLYASLERCQADLLNQLPKDLIVPVPASSFHMTLADLLWNGAYKQASETPNFDDKVQEAIAQSFQQAAPVTTGEPLDWQVIGLMLAPRALGVVLAPKTEDSYNRLLQFRRSIYQNPSLLSLGIEQQYHLTAHITLGYFGEIPPNLDRESLSVQLSEFNDRWLDNTEEILVEQAQLCKFDDMTRYYRHSDSPVFVF